MNNKVGGDFITFQYRYRKQIILVTTILAYLPWSSFKITLFDDITKAVNEFTIFGSPVISYVFGEFTPFGNWNLFNIQYVMLAAILLIKIFGRVSFDEIITDIETKKNECLAML